MSETNAEPTNCLDIIEQLRYDRDKYIGMWRAQCRITEQTMKERDAIRGAKSANVIKYTFGKNYHKPITPFQKFWNGGVGTFDMPKSHIAEDAWNAALYLAKERLRMYGENGAADLLDILVEEQ